jgi:deglycase
MGRAGPTPEHGMSVGRKLEGRRVAVLAADGFEKVELAVPVAALRAAGAEVEIVSLRPGRIRGMNLHEPAARVLVDRTLAEASPDAYEALLIPGGLFSLDLLRQSEAARQFVRRFDAAKKPIATLCHGSGLLASARLTQGRTMTSWPGIRDDLVNAGATWLDQKVVRDGNWVTSRGPEDIAPFCKAIVEFFAGGARKPVSEGWAGACASQRDAPPRLVVGAVKWLARPSLRTAAITVALLALFAMRSRRKRLAAA